MLFKDLSDNLTRLLADLPGDVALSVNFLATQDQFNSNEQLQFWAASVIKVPIACTLFNLVAAKKVSLTQRLPIAADNYVLGSGIVKLLDMGVLKRSAPL